MKVLIRALAARLQRLSPLAVTILGLCLVAALGAIDYCTPGPISFVLFYLLVVVLVARRAGKWHAVLVSAVAVITMATVQWGLGRGAPQTVWVVLWNNSTRFLVFSIAGWLTAEVTRLTQHLSELVEQRTAQWQAEAAQHKAISARLAETLERFEQVINNITEVFWLTNVPKNQIAYVSPGYERVWGRKCEDLYREPGSWVAAVHPADRDEVLRHAQTDQTAGSYDVEYRIVRPDGAVRWIRDRAFPVRNQQGEVYRIAGLAEDITERKRTREMLQTQAAILENMAEGVIVTDDQGVVVQMNPAAERIWGYERNEVVGQPVSVLSGLPESEATTVIREVLETLQAKGSWRGTFKNRRKDGVTISCEAVISRLEVQGRVLMVAVEQEVTDRLRAQEQLQMQARVLESMAEAAVMVDEAGTIVLTNPALDALLGYAAGELTGKPLQAVTALTPEAYRSRFEAAVEQLQGTDVAVGQYVARRKDGALIQVEARGCGLRLGDRFFLVLVGQDITQRKRAEQALRDSEETLRVFLDALPESAFLLDREGTILVANQALARNLGRTDDLVGQYAFGLLPARLAESRKAMFDEVVRTRKPARYEDMRGDRHFMNFESPVLDAAGNVTRMALFALDITEHKRADKAIRESEQTYRALVETTGTGYLILDMQGRVLDANTEYIRLSGHKTLQDILGRNVMEWTAPEDRERNAAAIDSCLKTGAVRNLEISYAGPDGLTTAIEINGTVVQTPRGPAVLSLCRDITQRKQVESTLARQEALYRTLFELSPDGILLEDTHGNILDVNQALSQSFGYSRAELLHQNVRWFMPLEQQGEVEAHLATLRAGHALEHEVGNLRKDGQRCLMRLNEKPLALPDGRQGVLVVARDITQSKRAEMIKEVFLSLGAKLSSVRSPEEAARAIYASADQLWKWDSATLSVYSQESDVMEAVLFCDVVDGQRRDVPAVLPAGAPSARMRRIMQHGAELILRRDTNTLDTDCLRFGDVSRPSASFMCVPMRQEGQPVGVLAIQSYTPDAYTQDDLRTLQALADYCAGALERIRAEVALREAHDLLEVRVRERTRELETANRALRESEARLRLALDASNAGIWSWDVATRQSVWDERYHALYGFEPDEPISYEAWLARVHPEDREKLLTRIQALLASGTDDVWNEEFRARHPVKGERWMAGLGRIERDPAGRAVRVAGINLDITERKQADMALNRTNAILQAINQGTDNLICLKDLQGKIILANPAICRFLGKTESEVIGTDDLDSLPDQQQAASIRKNDLRVLKTGRSETVEESIDQPDRRWHCLFTKSPFRDECGKIVGLIGIGADITARKRAEEALREAHDLLERRVGERTAELQAANTALSESEERYRSLVTNLNVGVYRNTPGPHGRFLHANPALARMHGYDSVEEFQKIEATDLYQAVGEREAFLAELLRRGAVVHYELHLKKKDGTPIYSSVNATVHRGPTGEVEWIDGMIEDITERKKAEQSLAEALDLNRTLIAASTVGIAVYKGSGQCVIANQALARITGGTLEELLQQDFRRLKSWRTDGLLAKAEAALATGQPQELEACHRTTFGQDLTISAGFSPFTSQGEHHLLLMLTDETEAARAQKALRASEERYRALAESSPDAIFILDRDIKVQYVNSTTAAVWKRRPEDMIGMRQADLFPPEAAERYSNLAAEVFATGQPLRRDEPLPLPIGEQWIDIRLVPLFGEQRTVNSVMGVCHNITKRKRAERQLSEALDLNQKMIAASAMCIAAYRTSGECVFANEALARIVGGSLSEVLQGNFRQMKSLQGSALLKLAEEALSQGCLQMGEAYITTRFGKTVWLDCQVAPFVSNGQPHLLLMALDISERKRAESLLQTQRDLGVSLSQSSDLGAALNHLLSIAVQMGGVDCGGIYLANPATGGMDLGAHRGLTARFVKAVSLMAPESPQIKIVLQGRPVFGLHPDLPIRYDEARRLEGLRASAIVPLCHEGRVIGTLALASHKLDEIPRQAQLVIEAIAAQVAGAIVRIRAEEALRQSDTRLRAIISGAPVMLFAVDRDGIIRFEGGQSLQALGANPGENVGRSVTQVYAHLPGILESTRRALKGETFETVVEAGPITLDCWYSPTRDKDGNPDGYIGVATNTTERHRLERQILEISDREQARIGQDIHDGLCQHLVSLAFDANSLQRDLSAERRPEAKTARRIADFLDKAITESRQLSRGLFPVRLGTVGLTPALQELADSTSARFKIQCRFDGNGPLSVKHAAIATHLYRIAQEAVANAVKHSQARTVSIRLRARTNQIELRVEDDGAGLSPAKRKQATGLGLHIMDYRARAIGGTLQITPRRRGGTIVSCCVARPKR